MRFKKGILKLGSALACATLLPFVASAPLASQGDTSSSIPSSQKEVGGLKVFVEEDPKIVWGTRDPDLAQFFSIEDGNFSYKVSKDMIFGEVNTLKKGSYPIRFEAVVDGVPLKAETAVEVVSKVEIETPLSENPTYDIGMNNAPDYTVASSLFTLKVDGRKVDILPDWIEGKILGQPGTYPITLSVPIQGQTYSKTVNVHAVNSSYALYSSYTEEAPYEVKRNSSLPSATDVFQLSSSGVSEYFLVDRNGATVAENKGSVVLLDADFSAVDLSKVGTYRVTGKVKDAFGKDQEVEAYVKVASNISIAPSSAKGFYQEGRGLADERSLFELTVGGEKKEASLLSITSSPVDWGRAGTYDVVARYEDGGDVATFVRAVTVVAPDFFGSFERIDVAESGYQAEFSWKEDGSVDLFWQKKDYAPVRLTGSFDLTSKGGGKIVASNDRWNFNFTFAYVDEIVMEAPDPSKSASSSNYYDNLSIYLNKAVYDLASTRFYKEGKTGEEEKGIDLLAAVKSQDKSLVRIALVHDISSSSFTLSGVYPEGKDFVYQEKKDGSETTYQATLGEVVIGFSLTPGEGVVGSLVENSYVDNALPQDVTGLSGVELKGEGDKVLTLTFSLDYQNVGTWSAKGSRFEGTDLSTGFPSALIFDDEKRSTFLIADVKNRVETPDKKYEREIDLLEVDVDKVNKTYVLKEAETNQDIQGEYLFAEGRANGAVTVHGDYAFYLPNLGYGSSANFFSIARDGALATFVNLNHEEETYQTFKGEFVDGNNRLKITESGFPTLDVGYVGNLYGDIRGDELISSADGEIFQGDAIDPETLASLFTFLYRDAQGVVKTAEDSQIAVDASGVDNGVPGIYKLVATFTNPTTQKVLEAVSFLHVKPVKAEFSEYALQGEYSGYWTYGPNSPATVTISKDGILTLKTTTFSYQEYLVSTGKPGEYYFTTAGYQGLVWLEDGVVYGRVIKGFDTVSYLLAAPGIQGTYEAVASTEVDGVYNQSVLLIDSADKASAYFLSPTYRGKVSILETTPYQPSEEGVSGTTYSLSEDGESVLSYVRVLQRESEKVVYSSDSLFGDFSLDGKTVHIDGFGNASIDGDSSAYGVVPGTGNKVLLTKAGDASFHEVYAVEGNALIEVDGSQADAMGGKLFRVKVDYASGSDQSRLSMDVAFDGHGFVSFSSEAAGGKAYGTYEVLGNGTVKIDSGNINFDSLTLLPKASGNYVVEGEAIRGDGKFFINLNFTIPDQATFTLVKG